MVETGLGGRLDATNILPPPEVSVITNIDLEHTRFLGNSMSAIAREKAGIVKKGTVCVTGAPGPALSAIAGICKSRKVKLIPVSSRPLNSMQMSLFESCSLQGAFQRKNFRMALEAVKVMRKNGWRIASGSVQRGLKRVEWPCRFEFRNLKIKNQKIPLLMDGAHNPAAVRALAESVRETGLGARKCCLLFNALKDKNVLEMACALMRKLRVAKVAIPSLNHKRSSQAEEVRDIFVRNSKKIQVQTFNSVRKALDSLSQHGSKMDFDWILATGSFYLLGEMLGMMSNPKEKVMKVSES